MIPDSLLSATQLAERYIEKYPGEPSRDIAKHAAAALNDMAARLILIDLLDREVSRILRGEAHVVEVAHTTVVAPVSSPEVIEQRRERRQVMKAQREVADRAAEQDAMSILMAYLPEVTLDLTPEFLNTTFKVNGRDVAWGDATDAEDEQYMAVMAGPTLGNLETIARHNTAIIMRQEAGVSTLWDLYRQQHRAAA